MLNACKIRISLPSFTSLYPRNLGLMSLAPVWRVGGNPFLRVPLLEEFTSIISFLFLLCSFASNIRLPPLGSHLIQFSISRPLSTLGFLCFVNKFIQRPSQSPSTHPSTYLSNHEKQEKVNKREICITASIHTYVRSPTCTYTLPSTHLLISMHVSWRRGESDQSQ